MLLRSSACCASAQNWKSLCRGPSNLWAFWRRLKYRQPLGSSRNHPCYMKSANRSMFCPSAIWGRRPHLVSINLFVLTSHLSWMLQ